MDNGGVGTYDVGTLAGLRGIGFGAYGYGNQGNFLGDGSAVKEAVRGNRDLDLLESVNRTAADQALSDRITTGNQLLSSQINMGNEFLTDRIASQALNDRFATLERQLAANAASAEREFRTLDVKLTECCCELKAGQATIIANQEAARLAAAEAENQTLRMQIAINNQGSQGNS